MQRRAFLSLPLLLTLAAPVGALAQTPAAPTGERVYGNANAPVTIIEYASMTCSHCAHFHTGTLPELKKAYLDTGKVKLVFRDFPLDRVSLRAAQLTRCLPADRAAGFTDALFSSQASWAGAKDPEAALVRMAKLAGLSQDKIDACLADKTIEDQILGQRMDGAQKYNIDSTPSFIIDGKKVAGALSFAEMDKLLAPLVK